MFAPPITAKLRNDTRLGSKGPARSRSVFGSKGEAVFLLVAMGLSTTLYVGLGSLGGNALRPVQLVPCLLGAMVLLVLPCRGIAWKAVAPYLILPTLYVAYLAVRHVSAGPEGDLYLLKAMINLVAYWSIVRLLMHVGVPEFGYVGIVSGAVLSVCVSAVGVPLLGVTPHMGSGRWQGFMAGANHFGNICLLAAIPLCGWLFWGHHKGVARSLIIGTWLVCLVGIVMSGSRAVLGIAVLGHLFLYALAVLASPKAVLRRQSMATGGLAIGVLSVALWAFHDFIPTRVVQFVADGRLFYTAYASDARHELHGIAFSFFREAPIIGAGMDAARFEVAHEQHGFHETSSHSTYLHLLSVSGGLGFALYMLLPGYLAVQLAASFRAKRFSTGRQRMSCMIALVVMAVLGLHATVISLTNAMHIWIIFGVASYAVMEMHTCSGQPLFVNAPRARRWTAGASASVAHGR